jgi:hypothetical protein
VKYDREFRESATSRVPLPELIAWCRRPESRLLWPGADSVRQQGSVLYFRLNMEAPGGPAAAGAMEEYIGPLHEVEGGGSEFDAMFTLTWPSGEAASGQGSYRFDATDDKSNVTFTMRYVLPKKLGIGSMNKDVFLKSVDRALSLYTSRLANGSPS